MKKTVLTFASVIAMFAAPVFANDFSVVRATVVSSLPVHNTFTTPVTSRECRYEQQHGATGGDVLGGMIIGGLIGKGATGSDQGAAAGAVIGGMIGAENNRGGRMVEVCNNVTSYETHTSIVGYETKIEWNGIQTIQITNRSYKKGDPIRLRVYLEPHE